MSQGIRWRSVWDYFVTVTTVATCAYVVLTVGVQKVRTAQAGKIPIGTIIKSDGAVSFAEADMTLLVGMSSSCHFCEESLPAFRDLAKYVAKRSKTRAVALTLEPAKNLEAYLVQNGLGTVQPVTVDATAPLGAIAARTPQIVAVDTHGKVIASWGGKIGQDQMETFIARLPAQGPTR